MKSLIVEDRVAIKGYQVGEKIGQTGLKTFYRAIHLKSGKETFITLIHIRAGRSLDALIRRAEQSQKLATDKLQGKLITAIDYGVLLDERFYYSCEIHTSLRLKEVLDKSPERQRLFRAVRWLLDTLDVLEYLHQAGTTHRDLHTGQLRIDENRGILIDGFINDRPKIEAKNIASVVFLPYVSPEQLMGVAADQKTDLYSVGVILYELAIGKLPYVSNSKKIEDARHGTVPRPSNHKQNLPPQLEKIIMKALAPRESRYSHARELIDDLESFYSTRTLIEKMQDLLMRTKNAFLFKK